MPRHPRTAGRSRSTMPARHPQHLGAPLPSLVPSTHGTWCGCTPPVLVLQEGEMLRRSDLCHLHESNPSGVVVAGEEDPDQGHVDMSRHPRTVGRSIPTMPTCHPQHHGAPPPSLVPSTHGTWRGFTPLVSMLQEARTDVGERGSVVVLLSESERMLKRLRLDEEQSPLHRREMERKEAAVIEMVFGSNDLLAEILLRLGSPAWFVRAAAVCTRWLHRASDPIILRRFRALHPPRVLALRVASDLPVPLRQPSEFAAACRQAIATLSSSTVCDIRNGRMLVEILNPNPIGPPTFAVRNLLLPEGDKPFPSPPSKMCSISERCSCDSRLLRLLNDGGDTDNDTPCLCLDLTYSFEMFGVGYSILRSGVWTAPRSVTTELPQTLVNTMVAQKLIVGNKFYVMTTLGYILGLDLATASFFKVQLPNEARNSRDVKFSCGLDSELCLVAAKGLHLRIWHGDGAGQWVVVDTIFVPEVCRHLNVRRWIPVPDHRGWVAPVKVLAVTDNAEFVIFELVASGSACCMQVSNRVVQKMPMESLQEYTGIVRPVTMPWPPIFPADKANQE